ncbi:MAG TPA: MATE family efflux transporter [Methanocorpusculum sp.]|nr:MATE family efflux transporter [Methanocorpusculum sp.]
MAERENIVTEGSITKALFIIALPIIISNILQSVLEVVDMYFIGHLGDDAIAGGTMSLSIIMVLTTVMFGVVTATAAFISRAYGSKQYERIQVILAHALYLALIISAIIAVIGLFWSEELLLLMGAEPGALAEGAKFLRPMLMGLFGMIILMTLVTAFQSSGDSRTPMYVMIAVNIVNIILNPTLIQGLAGLPAFGIAGSAYASILSRTAGIVLLLGVMYLHPAFKNSPVRLPVKLTFEPQLVKNIIVIAIPSALQSGIRSFGFLMMTSLITIGYGTVAVAAYGIAIRLDMLGFIIVMGLCTAIAVMVGQNLGAGKVERAEMAVKYAVILNAIFMACVAVFYYLNAEMLLAFFGAEGETLKDGVIFMHIVPFSYFISAAAMTLGFAMNGAGMTRPGMYSAIAGQIFTQVARSAMFAYLRYPFEYVCYAIAFGSVIMCLCDYYFYHKGDWKRKKLNLGGDTAVDG